ncbi:hypothetical protein ACKTEK_02110 [Tepidamorphus sp. 3E244]|uniref:hypothetical protein n=1 Tax=Tepidamorphus sp. 3E244 TaxID=3385498 RepID=UPI0038FCCB97
MIRERTLFVLGAGASAELDMPLGLDLIKLISETALAVHGNKKHSRHLSLFKNLSVSFNDDREELNCLKDAAHFIYKHIYLASSIDNFIEIHKDNEYIKHMGKFAIADSILLKEQESSVYRNTQLSTGEVYFPKLSNSWYVQFFRLLFDGATKNNIAEILESLSFIIFNYDRIFEYLLLRSLIQTFGFNYEESWEIVDRLDIIHPFGTVGKIPKLEGKQYQDDFVGFGVTVESGLNVFKASQRIKTYGERLDSNFISTQITPLIDKCETLIFLGSAFHRQNLDILYLSNSKNPKQIYSTGADVYPQQVDNLSKRIMKNFLQREPVEKYLSRIIVEPESRCKDFFHKHWRNFSQ